MSYLKIKLETGRTHQIRVHMSELGHPLVGDLLYGYSAKKMKELGVSRFFLHAAELGFEHPKTKNSSNLSPLGLLKTKKN
jgi:23S rRNA pseudouridine1911/1915/1917 synthase